jgi:hypothetical protein
LALVAALAAATAGAALAAAEAAATGAAEAGTGSRPAGAVGCSVMRPQLIHSELYLPPMRLDA